MPARGVNLVLGSTKIGVAALAERHEAGLLASPQKYSQKPCSVRSTRTPRSRLNPGTRLYALLLTLPVALESHRDYRIHIVGRSVGVCLTVLCE